VRSSSAIKPASTSAYTMMARALCIALLVSVTNAQLRPRRVGTNALGEQEVVLTDVPTGGGAAAADNSAGGLDAMTAGLEAMQAAFQGGDGAGLDLGAMLKNMDMENNPMLKAMAQANPEMAKMFSDPEALKGQMEQVAKLMGSPEGQDMAANMMKEMQNVMTDPEKLKAGLEQLSSNPALQGLADAVPGLREVLDDPQQLEEQATKAAELFQSLADPSKAQELLEGLGGSDAMENLQAMLGKMGSGEGLAGMQDMMQKLAGLGEGGEGEGGLGDLLGGLGGLDGMDDEEGGGGDDLKARVREQMAAMMNKRRAGAGALDEDEF